MLVNATTSPAPAMWQGLMLIGISIWAIWTFNGKPSKAPNVFLAVYTVAASLLTYAIFS